MPGAVSRNVRRRRWLWPLIAVLVVGLGWALLRLLVIWALVEGETREETLAGAWIVRTWRSPMQHSGADQKLVRETKAGKVVVDELVYSPLAIGSDCVVYSTTRGMSGFQEMAVCGARLPVVLVPGSSDEWAYKDGELRLERTVGGEPFTPASIPREEIVRRARSQPPFREGWFKTPE